MNEKCFIRSEDARGVVTVKLNRPELHNAFNDQLIKQLINVFEELNQDPTVRAVVLTGEGKSFCAGADLNWMKRMKDYSFEENVADSRELSKLFKVINSCPVPVIGRINGHALGGGAGLLAVCDYVLAVDTAQIGFTEVKLGLVPAVISPFVIAKIGHSHARATFLSGMRFHVDRAMMMGLVHQKTTLENLDQDLEKVITEHLTAGPAATKVAKELSKKVSKMLWSEDLTQYTTETIAKMRAGNEGQEGMSALLEKRTAHWNLKV